MFLIVLVVFDLNWIGISDPYLSYSITNKKTKTFMGP